MSELSPDAEAALAAMPETDLTALLARVRAPEESLDPCERAARALRRHGPASARGRGGSKDSAVDALRTFRASAK